MGLFDALFGKSGNSETARTLPWIPLETSGQIDDIKKNSVERPQVIFKHSTTCGISRMVLNGFQKSYPFSAEEADLYYLDLHAHRNISNRVAEEFQVVHQSPQLLVVKNEKVVFHTSHGAITEVDLDRFLQP
ncbi:MAG: bacillithiol system redox-active protein YtxJ [Muricauda sp.]|nr:bacillithiol system redox-active protein YtxJ [Allomuricauda sp.]MAU27163.1 bacillithiol system redox-active protein YtxJ [Allomuricauda sp.]MBC29313.1 bacillithiol system redox-active protein YtxJ [Allomuricauda sp.]|tara:strand:- start:3843 stop:4238 length:396 start_codon:yes stop_codon:yes gene_type:complete